MGVWFGSDRFVSVRFGSVRFVSVLFGSVRLGSGRVGSDLNLVLMRWNGGVFLIGHVLVILSNQNCEYEFLSMIYFRVWYILWRLPKVIRMVEV